MTRPAYDPHRQADGVNRADLKLRSFGRRVGGATMCPTCDGDGFTLRRTGGSNLEPVIEPFRCYDCGGEGLDPRNLPVSPE